MSQTRRLVHVLTFVASVGVLAWWAGSVPEVETLPALAMITAFAWSTLTFAMVGALGWRRERSTGSHTGESRSMTVLVLVTEDDTDEKILTALALAQGVGEVILGDLAAEPRTRLVESLDVTLLTGEVPSGVANEALARAKGETFCILTGQACAVVSQLRLAAAMASEDVGWVRASTRPYNEDRFAPVPHASMDDCIDRLADGWGLHQWTPNATVLNTKAAREVGGFVEGRPWGHLLRRLSERGHTGARHNGIVTVVAAPSEPSRFWRSHVWAQRSRIAEAADTFREPGREDLAGRFAGLAVALRGLRGIPILLWIAGFGAVATTGDAFTSAPLWPMTAALLVTAALRMLVLCPSIDPLRFNEEIVRTVYQVPGSISAVPGLAGRTEPVVRATSITTLVPARILLFVGLLLCLVIGQGMAGVVGAVPVASEGVQGWGVTACAVVLFMLIQAIAYSGSLRRSGRDSYRFPIQLGVRVAGNGGRTLDLSAGGMRIRTGASLDPGCHVDVRVDFVGNPMNVNAEVLYVQDVPGSHVAGLRLAETAERRCAWTRALFAEAGLLETLGLVSDREQAHI